jgi:hypothetical protein
MATSDALDWGRGKRFPCSTPALGGGSMWRELSGHSRIY